MTWYKEADCTGEELEIQINEDGSMASIGQRELKRLGWKDVVKAVKVPLGNEAE